MGVFAFGGDISNCLIVGAYGLAAVRHRRIHR